MRIPRSSLHSRVFDLIRYLNTYGPAEKKIELMPYILDHENNLSFFQGKKGKLQDTRWAAKAGLPPQFHGRSAQELLGSVVLPWLNKLRTNFDAGFEELLEYDEYSFRAYLRVVARWPHEVIEFVELLCSQTNQYDLSFTEIVMQNLDFDTQEWATVKDGMSRITECAAALIGSDNIRLNSRVGRISYAPDGHVELGTGNQSDQMATSTFDAVVMAVPPSALHSITDRPRWSFMKEQSIRGTHFEPLYKIGLHFRTRFWERSTTPALGGQSTTDLRFRWIVYPSNDLGGDGSGVLLLYSWMTDAMKWAGLPPAERIKICLHDLSKFYADEPDVNVHDQYIEAHDILWMNELCGGDAMFLPGQFSRYHQVAKQPEGNIYFAGEHLSRHHTWIAGAVDSALSTTAEILAHHQPGKWAQNRHALVPLGREYVVLEPKEKAPGEEKAAAKMDISSRPLKAFIIPRHMNIHRKPLYQLGQAKDD
ncbi:Amine oxidase [Cordyceps fumosorosea ARSEF 2679]|uniref:Amine oxidase n=1 Tax=Cordyceps fumosorosea (strain ARSEF 2679) TaxID=1081104 RepID=A0A167V4K7_CORFA|nr:Amine oxidase [Cordyceps fumosorosea ARSEF 2679]OAA62218.1 Amine oxidase [Cordyceps fumosorosea ARSEF 2679]